jgi:hypothetical protein
MSDLQKATDAIIAMGNDCDALEKKFGENSSWVIEKRKNLITVSQFLDNTINELNAKDKEIYLLKVNYKAVCLILYKMEMDLSWKKTIVATGMKKPDVDQMKLLEALDMDIDEMIKNNG